MLLPSRNPFNCHEDVLSLQPMILPTSKRFDVSPPDWGMLRRPGCVQISGRPVLVGFGIGISTFLEFNKPSQVPINEKIVLSCPCYGDGYWDFGLLEVQVAHEFGSMSAGAHRAHTKGRVPARISNSNDMSKIYCCTMHLLHVMYIALCMNVQHV